MEIFKLVGSIMVDADDAQNSISKTGEKAEGLATKLGSGVKTAAKWGAAIVTAATAVGSAMVSAAKETASTADTIDKASKRMNISATSYQELEHAADLCGVSMTTMEKAAKKLEGTDINFDDAMNSIMSLGTAEERVAAASELFGETVAYQMEPLLQESTDSFNAMKQEAEDLGLVLSEDAVSSGASLNDQLTKIEGSITTLKNGLVSDLMPYVSEILDWVIENMPMIEETVQTVMDDILPIIEPVLEMVMTALPAILNLFKTVMDAIMPILEPIFEAIKEVFNGLTALINGDIDGFYEHFINILQNLGKAAYTLGKTIMTALWDGLKAIWEAISNWFTSKFSGLFNWVGNIGSTVKGWFSHASGIAYVPYDNYPAMLHRGETVLNANDTSSLLESVKSLANGGGDSTPINITIQSVLDGKVIGESVATYTRQKARAYG